MKKSGPTSKRTTRNCEYLESMNRIAIACLALLLAGCCKRSELDCRLVGTWVLQNDWSCPSVFIFNSDGTCDMHNWSYSESAGLTHRGTNEPLGYWRATGNFIQRSSTEDGLESLPGVRYEVSGDSLSGMGLICPRAYWRYD